MTDPDADELAYINEVLAKDDRLRAERAYEAERRAAEGSPVRKSGPDGLVYKTHGNSAPARALTYDAPADDEAAGFSLFGNPEIDKGFFDVLGEAFSDERQRACGELKQAVDPLREEIVALRTELRGRIKGILEMRGAFRIRGSFREEERYQALDVVSIDGRWYVARCDGPGPCPGLGWEPGPEGNQGAQGERGLRGSRGAPGRDAPKFFRWEIDRPNYRVVAKMSDGSEMPPLELRGLFEQFLDEVERRG